MYSTREKRMPSGTPLFSLPRRSGLVTLALFTTMLTVDAGLPAQAEEVLIAAESSAAIKGPGTSQSSVAVAVKVVPAGSRQEKDVLAALADALRQEPSPRTLAEIDQWSERLTMALRQGGFPIGQVLMTQEDWLALPTTGRAVFTVFPGRISEIEVENKSRMDTRRLNRVITQAMCGQELDPTINDCLFQTKRFERATQLLQDLPGVALDGAPRVGPGNGVGDVKPTFVIAEKGKPYALSASVDNNGMAATGRIRGTLAVSANNYFGLGEDYAASITGTDEKNMWTGSLTGGIPILYGGLRAAGGFTRQQYTVSAGGTSFVGVSNTGMVGVTYPFTRGLDANLSGGLFYLHSEASVDYRDFGFATNSTIDAVKFSLTANNGDRAQQLRTNQWAAQLALTTGRQHNDDVLDVGPHRAGEYAKLASSGFGSLGLNRGGDFFATARVSGQVVSRNLDPGEQMAIGGPYAVRAYRPDEPMADDGVVLNLGLYQRFPVAGGHQIQFGPILDYAICRVNHSPWVGWEYSYPNIAKANNTRQLAGYGLEAAWLTPFGATFTVSASKPFGFSDESWIEPNKKPIQCWFTASWNY
ncbi:MAG: hypothetical protein FWD79_12450 [Desulfobulbus sp.]|nr:hypothetical protein [Desulfobulbus sp.]